MLLLIFVVLFICVRKFEVAAKRMEKKKNNENVCVYVLRANINETTDFFRLFVFVFSLQVLMRIQFCLFRIRKFHDMCFVCFVFHLFCVDFLYSCLLLYNSVG